ncbi:hypothetical protein ABVT39_028030 [Epinephelus coioides]
MQQNFKMLRQRNGLSLQSPLRPLSVLVFHLLLTHSCRGQSQLIGSSQPIVATVGDDIILPCHLEPAVDIAAMTLEWTRSDLDPEFVFVWRAGLDLVHTKHPSYKGRTSLFSDELKRGNISLKLSDVRPSDAGRYRCFIPDMRKGSFIELVVGAVSSPVITLAGIDKASSGVVLQCESAGWYPEPEVLWLDGEGNLLSAGPTETVRGPDDLYTVSSRVTVEKRHSNSFTCRVQQRNINQTTETHVSVSDNFFKVQSGSSIITGLAVSLAFWIVMFIVLLLLFLWKWRQDIIKTKKSHFQTGEDKKKKTDKPVDQFVTEEEIKPLKEEQQQQLQEEQQKRKEAEDTIQTLKEKLETQKLEYESKEAEVQRQLQSLKEELETKNREPSTQFGENKVAQSVSLLPWTIIHRQTLENEQQWREQAEKQIQDLKQILHKQIKEFVEEQQGRKEAEKRVKTLEEELKTKEDEAQKHRVLLAGQQNTTHTGKGNLKKQFKQRIQKQQSKEDPEMEVQTPKGKKNAKTKDKQAEVQQLQDENQTTENNQQTLNQKDHNLTSPANQDSAKKDITVDEVNVDGKYVRLSNNSEKDQPMGDWELHIRVNKRKPIRYQFYPSFILKAGKTVTIWASDCGVSCETSTDLVWFGQQPWGTGEQLLVTIYSNTGELEVNTMLGLPNSQSKPQEQQTHLVSQDSAMGNITVSDIDLKGSYVRLSNTSDKDQQLKDWELHIQVNDRKPIMYKFSSSFILKAGNTVTIWSSDRPGRNKPPTDLVWQNQKSWGTGEELLITLYNNTGETHLVSQDSAMGNITVSDIDLKGSYVRLSNTSDKDQSMEGWELHIQVNDRKPMMYKFFSSFILEAGNTVTIWSSDHPGRNEPPTDLVWFSQKSWGTGEELLVTVYNNTGEVEASKMLELGSSQTYQEKIICVTSQDSTTGPITVDEVDLKGEYVRLSNTSNKDQPMGGWELHIQVNNRKPIVYQFKPSFILKAGDTINIWAHGHGVWFEKSTDLVWSSQKAWGTGEQLLVTVYSNTGEVEASKMLELGSSQTYQEKIICVTSQDSTTGPITVDEVDLKGEYVRLSNTSDKAQELKDWELHIQVNNRKPIVYKFSSSFILVAGNTVTIWSSDHPDRNDPPTDLLWQNQKSWGTGELLVTVYNNTGEEMATKLKTPNISEG